MQRKIVIVGLVILTLLVAGYLWQRRRDTSEVVVEPTPTSATLANESEFEERFRTDIPDEADKVMLEDQTDEGASGIATREFKDDQFTLVILADLPGPEAGAHYQAWLEKSDEGEEDFERVRAGVLTSVKGGWSTTFNSETDLTDYGRVVVSEERTTDNNLEEVVLRASF